MDDDRNRTLQSEATRLADAARERAAGAFEEIKLASNQVVDKVRDLIEEGNVRRISLRKGERVLFEIPLTVGVGAGAAALLTSPLLAAVGAVAALVSDLTVVIEREEEDGSEGDSASDAAGSDDTATADKSASGTSDKGKSASGGNASGNNKGSGTSSDASNKGGDKGDTSASGEKTVGKPSGDA